MTEEKGSPSSGGANEERAMTDAQVEISEQLRAAGADISPEGGIRPSMHCDTNYCPETFCHKNFCPASFTP